MPSTNKTDLGLNQWLGTDKPKRLDFNADNDIIQRQFDRVEDSMEQIREEAVGRKADGLGAEIFNAYPGDPIANYAEGDYAHAEGAGTGADGYASHAEGLGTAAEGDCAHAEGRGTEATGTASHAQGTGTEAVGDCSFAGGEGTVAAGDHQTVLGRYNVEDPNKALVIGGGSFNESRADDAGYDGDRANIFAVDWNGNAFSGGDRLVPEPELSPIRASLEDHEERIQEIEINGGGGSGGGTPSTELPKMDGTASAGASESYARGDHVHPTDTSRAAASHNHSTDNLTSGVLGVARGGTGQTSLQATRNAMGLGNTTGVLPPANGGTGQTSLQATRNAMGLGNTTGVLPPANGGTGQTSLQATRNAMGLGNTTGVLPIANGGTGASTAAQALVNLGVTPANNTFQIMGIAKAIYPISSTMFPEMNLGTPNFSTDIKGSTRWTNLYIVNNPNVSSDARLKKNVEDIDTLSAMRLTKDLKAKRFIRKDDRKGAVHFGYIAQEVAEAFQQVGINLLDNGYSILSNDEYMGLSYEQFIPILWTEVQRQQGVIDSLEQRLAALEQRADATDTADK